MNIKNLMPFRRHHVSPYSDFGFNRLTEMQDRMNDLMNSFFTVPSTIAESASFPFLPFLNVSENDKQVNIKVELPGLEEKDVQIESRGNQLIIKGERKEEKEDKGNNYHIRESFCGKFSRTVSLPFDVDVGKTNASFKNGMLHITIDKPKEAQGEAKSIPIKKG